MKAVHGLDICGLILAAGKGTRMQSDLPKVLHKIAGKTLLQYVTDTLHSLGLGGICVVLGGEIEQFSGYLEQNKQTAICQQLARQGTGDAVASTACYFKPEVVPSYARGQLLHDNGKSFSHMLICLGDSPAINPETLTAFIAGTFEHQAKIAVLGMEHPNPKGYGRIVCGADGGLLEIVEEKNATPEQKGIKLCNTGVIFAEKDYMFSCLAQVEPNAAVQEYYLTDCFAIARQRGDRVYVHRTANYREFDGVNDQAQLQSLSEWMRSMGRI